MRRLGQWRTFNNSSEQHRQHNESGQAQTRTFAGMTRESERKMQGGDGDGVRNHGAMKPMIALERNKPSPIQPMMQQFVTNALGPR